VEEVCVVIRKRLDDSKDFVRLAACEGLKKTLALGKKVNCLGEVVKGLLSALEEEDSAIVKEAREALAYAQALDPSLQGLSPV
jgi:HEAT repeat protein